MTYPNFDLLPPEELNESKIPGAYELGGAIDQICAAAEMMGVPRDRIALRLEIRAKQYRDPSLAN